jgi:hypothetical protein
MVAYPGGNVSSSETDRPEETDEPERGSKVPDQLGGRLDLKVRFGRFILGA